MRSNISVATPLAPTRSLFVFDAASEVSPSRAPFFQVLITLKRLLRSLRQKKPFPQVIKPEKQTLFPPIMF